MASLGPGWALGTHITNHPPLRTEQHIDSARLVSCPQPSCRPAPQLVSLGLAEDLSGKDGLSLREQTVQERRSHRREAWGWGDAQSPSGPNSAASPGPRASSLPPGEDDGRRSLTITQERLLHAQNLALGTSWMAKVPAARAIAAWTGE